MRIAPPHVAAPANSPRQREFCAFVKDVELVEDVGLDSHEVLQVLLERRRRLALPRPTHLAWLD